MFHCSLQVLIKLGWQGKGSAVDEVFISFLTIMVSAATSFLLQVTILITVEPCRTLHCTALSMIVIQ